jgi:hypothetical protein
MEEGTRPPFAMKLVINWDGEVTGVEDYTGGPAPNKPVPSGHHHVKDVNHVVGVHEGSRCVTYQTPQGPRTV